MQRAVAVKSMPWNRSKIMLVGEGRVGKTALCNGMIGKPFVETESTVGLSQMTCDVRRAAATSDGLWSEHTKPVKEYEAGLAQVMGNIETYEREVSDKQATQITECDSKPPHSAPESGNYSCEPPHKKFKPASFLQTTPAGDMVDYSVLPAKPDIALVMKCLADVNMVDSNLILSLFDFGGQSVFNIIHHLFLTSYGVYLVVFKMADVLSNDKREQSLSEMSFWINSIVMHTQDKRTSKLAPIFLVGTHKDEVSDTADHDRISEIIEERFRYAAGWPYIQENQDLCFFAVDNVLGRDDTVIVEMMSRIEDVLKEADYVKEHRPLTWLRALDALLATKKSFLTLTEAKTIAMTNEVEEDDVLQFLTFLNDMGVIFWLNESELKDVVILDIITFFVEPATLIICNHQSKPSDKTVHHRDIISTCRKTRPKEWDLMTMKGQLSRKLMEFLLGHKVEVSNVPVVIKMMLKFGLIVRLEQTQDETRQVEPSPALPEYYLVPALLPAKTLGDPTRFQDEIWNRIKIFNSCFFVFSTASDLSSLQPIVYSQLRAECFLPRGIMERLIGKAVQWSQLKDITNIHNHERLYQNYAALSYRNQEFRLVCIPEINCIRLDIEGEYPLDVHHAISEMIILCIKECMGSLQFITALRLGCATELDNDFVLLNLEDIKAIQLEGISITVGDDLPINRQNYPSHFGPWIVNTDILPSYDAFISHRWHEDKDDDEGIGELYESFCGRCVDSKKRAVDVFYDKIRLKDGRQYQTEFGKALINSTILVPIFCTLAFQKMLNHDPTYEDNVLIEWMLALECMQDPTHSKMRGIYPLMFGERKADGSVGNLFAEGAIDRLPDTIPTASIEVVRTLLKENGFTVSSTLATLTVRRAVKEVSKYKGLLVWECPNGYSTAASEAIVKQVEYYISPTADILTMYTGQSRSVLECLRGYTPAKSCREHMLDDLPTALRGVLDLQATVRTSTDIASNLPNPYGLSSDEALAVLTYTSDLRSGNVHSLYYHVNNVLRLRKSEALCALKPYLSYLMSAMEKFPIVKGTVYRGVAIDGNLNEIKEKYCIGTTVDWSAFTSTSTNIASALKFRENGRPFIMFQIQVINGRNMSMYSLFPDEEEVLLSPNSRFFISECSFSNMGSFPTNESFPLIEKDISNTILVKMIEIKDETLVF